MMRNEGGVSPRIHNDLHGDGVWSAFGENWDGRMGGLGMKASVEYL